jgi:DNA-directed RNA polymerase subunit E'/Rpb7
MPVHEITRDIRVHPKNLSHNLNGHLLDEITKQLLNECTLKNGHVIKILEITKILDNKIENSSSDIVVTVVFLIEIFKPVVDATETGEIIAIYADGLLVNINNVQKVLIPASTYTDKFNMEKNILVSITGDETLKPGDILNVKIKAIRYNDHKFSCIGELT